jgi:hypothetical protein
MTPLLIEGTQQVPVKDKKQQKAQANTRDTCKLHGKAQFAPAFFTKSNRQAKTNTAKQSYRSHDNGYDPSQNSQKTIIPGTGNRAQKQIEKRKTSIK